LAGNPADATRWVDQSKLRPEKFPGPEFVWVGERGRGKSQDIPALAEAPRRSLTALPDPPIRGLLSPKVLPRAWCREKICEAAGHGVRYLLRRNPPEAERERHRREDKLAKRARQVAARPQGVKATPRCRPEAGQPQLPAWAERHKLRGWVEVKREGRRLGLERKEAKIEKARELAGCYGVTTDVFKPDMRAEEVHASSLSRQKGERDFRTLQTGLREGRPGLVSQESRTRGPVFSCRLALKLSRELERRLQAKWGTTQNNPHALTLPDALRALGSLGGLEYKIDEKTTVTKRPQPRESQPEILTALGVSLPAPN